MERPKLKLSGQDGNACMILGLARKIALANNMDWEKIRKEAMAGDYEHLLLTMTEYFEVE